MMMILVLWSSVIFIVVVSKVHIFTVGIVVTLINEYNYVLSSFNITAKYDRYASFGFVLNCVDHRLANKYPTGFCWVESCEYP